MNCVSTYVSAFVGNSRQVKQNISSFSLSWRTHGKFSIQLIKKFLCLLVSYPDGPGVSFSGVFLLFALHLPGTWPVFGGWRNITWLICSGCRTPEPGGDGGNYCYDSSYSVWPKTAAQRCRKLRFRDIGRLFCQFSVFSKKKNHLPERATTRHILYARSQSLPAPGKRQPLMSRAEAYLAVEDMKPTFHLPNSSLHNISCMFVCSSIYGRKH